MAPYKRGTSPFPINFLMALRGNSSIDKMFEPLSFPDDILPSTYYVIYSGLTENEQQVIISWYRDNKTLEKIASEMGLSKERIRQLRVRACGKITYDHNLLKFLIYGVKGCIANSAASINGIPTKYLDSKVRTAIDLCLIVKENDGDIYSIPIKNLGLTRRTYNALRRAGIVKSCDLFDMSDAEMLKRVKGFGKASLGEVRAVTNTLLEIKYTSDTNDILKEEN